MVRDLDYLPFPDREDLPVKYYHDFELVGEPNVQMWSTRGCPFNCIFCIERQVIYAKPFYRKRDPLKVVDEMEYVKERWHAKQVYFDDETMTVDRTYVKAIAEEVIKRGLCLPWACMADVTIDRESLKRMAKSGCVGIKFGVETTSAETLKVIGKSFVNTERTRNLVRWCKDLGIWTHATYMVGLPTDTKEDILATLAFAKKLATDSIQVSIATPFPGTPFFELAEKNGWLSTYDWTLFDGANYSVISYPHLSKTEIETLKTLFDSEWWMSRKRQQVKRALVNPLRLISALKKHGLNKAAKIAIDTLKGK